MLPPTDRGQVALQMVAPSPYLLGGIVVGKHAVELISPQHGIWRRPLSLTAAKRGSIAM